ncbi:unnamed protein product (macronuclear) [Paramecium tetraurelia]|uniref:Uncharacterized protein n=1 Tax=Paramecium tetraurelia TaxID=5888 RepID=A0CWT9_PARTE|nr:uncharacterized protein GSPATT00001459001 [Paramecium tetraurelia]CAK75256.1 unnamed protein product [Paramecium tetraurelia]|eukprot:XP_001442653.1 hypothetical protein (macronuclear) [Paramecium tetraurelia strain d4-2]
MDNCCGIMMMQSSHPSFIDQYKNMVVTTQVAESIFHSQSCSFHPLTQNHTLILTSGYLLAKFAEDINTFDTDQIKKHVKFGLLKEQNKFVELNLLCLTYEKSIVDCLNQFDIDRHVGYVLYLEMLNSKETLIIPKYIDGPLKEGQQLISISSPFAIQGQEMYKNYFKKAIISQIITNNKFEQQLIVLDLISQTGQEGGAIFNSNGEYVGMILQNVQIGQAYNRYFTFCLNWKVINSIFQSNFNLLSIQQLFLQSQLIDQMFLASNFVQSDFGQIGSAVIINDKMNQKSYILTASNFLINNGKGSKILVGLNQIKGILLEDFKKSYNITLAKCGEYLQSSLFIEDFINYKELEVGQPVYLICYQEGVFQNQPYISRGRILKLIKNEIDENSTIITNCYLKNCLNGGGLFSEQGKLIGLLSNVVNYMSEGIFCGLTIFTPILLFDQLFKDLYYQKQITEFTLQKLRMIQQLSNHSPYVQSQYGQQNPKL